MSATSKTKRTLIVGFIFCFTVIILSSIVSYKGVNGLLSSLGWVEHTTEVEQELSAVLSLMKDVETGQRGFLITNRPKFLEPHDNGKANVWKHFEKAKTLTQDNGQQQKTFDTLEALIKEKLQIVGNTIQDKIDGKQVTTETLEHGKIMMDSIRAVTTVMISREDALMKTRTERYIEFSKNAPLYLFISSVLAIFILIYFFIRIRDDHKQKMMLETQLKQKDEELQKKIAAIDRMAKDIADGKYDSNIRPDDLK